MTDLDNVEEIKKHDSRNMIGSLVALRDQLKAAWSESRLVQIPPDYKDVRNIVVAGMGGSALGAHFIRSVFDVSLPLQIVNDYELPSFVDERSLVIVSSYTGTTEEAISAFRGAQEKKAKIIGITSDGTLAEILKKESKPFYQFDPKYNPSGQQRLGLGYSIGGILSFLVNLGWVSLSEDTFQKALDHLMRVGEGFGIESKTSGNEAKTAALDLVGKVPIVVAGPFLAGNAHIFANQLNESAKTFAAYFILPEINHHLLEGSRFPKNLNEILKFVFLETDLYNRKIIIRSSLTKQVLDKAGIGSISYTVKAIDKVQAAFETLLFSSWTSFYLAIANEVDPSPIPNVEFFKEQLAKLA